MTVDYLTSQYLHSTVPDDAKAGFRYNGGSGTQDPPLTARPVFLSSPFVVFAVAAVLVAALSSQAQTPGPLTLLSREGRRPIPLAMVADQEFVALDDLAAAFQLVVREEAGAITIAYKGKTIVLTPEQALASVAGRLVSLPAPPARAGRRWLVPVEFISRALALVYDTRLDLRKASHLLIVGDLRVPRVTARYDPVGAGGRLTIDATPRATSTVTQDNEQLTIRFDADALDLADPLLPQVPQGFVKTIRVLDATTLAVDLDPRVTGFRSSAQPIDTTMRLAIDITAPTDAAAAPPAVTAPELPPPFAAPASPVRTIALDPGHGGEDPGVQSADGTKEKDLTLAIARRAKAAIEGRLGIRVLMTRDDDRTVPVDDRTAVANNNKADLFISLHANASLRKSVAGASIYCAAFDEEAVKAAGAVNRERLPAFGGTSRDIELILWDLAQIRHIDQSTAFAAILERQFTNRVPLALRPIDRAPLRVLESANMPAVLVEMGFLSNPEQNKQLVGNEFQNAFVQALFDAVVKFRDSLASGSIQ